MKLNNKIRLKNLMIKKLKALKLFPFLIKFPEKYKTVKVIGAH